MVNGEERDQELEHLKAKTRAQVQDHCQRTGCRFNPDRQTVSRLITALARRAHQFGEPYCPCRVMTGDPEKDKDIICPCVYHEEEIAADGICHCFLFCSSEYAAEHRGDVPPEGV